MILNKNIVHIIRPKRIQKEIKKFTVVGSSIAVPSGVGFTIHPENYRYFLVALSGPINSPYEGGIFYLEMFLTKEYPMKPPKCRFLTPIIHPNIDKLGRICLDVLKDKWTPALTMTRVAVSIQLLLSDPNPDDPLDSGTAYNNGYYSKWINSPDFKWMTESEIHELIKEATKKYAFIPKDLMY